MTLFKKKLHSSFTYLPYKSDSRSFPSSSSSFFQDPSSLNGGKGIQLSIRFTYLLTHWPPQYLLTFAGSCLDDSQVGTQHPSLDRFTYFNRFSPSLSKEVNFLTKLLLPGRRCVETVKQMQLALTWPSIAEELIVDNRHHSDLQPRGAPKWSLRALFMDCEGRLDEIDSHLVGSNFCSTTRLMSNWNDLKVNFRRFQIINFFPFSPTRSSIKTKFFCEHSTKNHEPSLTIPLSTKIKRRTPWIGWPRRATFSRKWPLRPIPMWPI